MAALKFLRLVAGQIVEVFGLQTSAGAGDAGKIVSLDDTGRLDTTMMPVGIGADTATVTTSEILADGDFVNIHNVAGAFRVRKADATVAGKEADGFVLAGFAAAAPALVYFEGPNTHVSGQTPGAVYLQTTAGQAGATVPNTAGNVVQRMGVAVSATVIDFERGTPVTLA